jgi:hypothetical protein
MNSVVLEPEVKERLLADCQDFLRSEDWYVSHPAFTGDARVQRVYRYAERGEFLSYCTVEMQVIIVIYLERVTLPTWVPATRCARKVFQYLEVEAIC